MNLGQAFLEALSSLSSNKLRSGLTILGIVIGVATVIAMLAVGAGAQDAITGSISGLGSNLLYVFQGNFTETVRNVQPLTVADVDAIKDEFLAPSVKAAAPLLQGNVTLTYAGKDISTQLQGITPEYQTISNYTLIEGDFITNENVLGQASVVIIGTQVADKLFERREGIVGETIRIEGQPFRVIGVLASKGGSSFGSQDNTALAPFSTAASRLIRRGRNRVDRIVVQAVNAESVTRASDEVSQILRTRHRILLGADDFTVFSQQDFVKVVGTITGVLTIFLGGIAGISLLVGGIGIMNIMLVSVTERTREIGLRKAIGARKRDIMIQFLTESSLLSLIGGLVGIGFAWVLSAVVSQVATANGTPFSPRIGLDAVLLATIFSTAVGLFFGLYPANRAASLVPVEALRYE